LTTRNAAPERNFKKIAALSETPKTADLGGLAQVEDTNPRWRYRKGRFWRFWQNGQDAICGFLAEPIRFRSKYA
jgi:hypothetical protein